MANITGDGNFTSKLKQALSTSSVGIVGIEFFSALNIFLSITASLGNALILIALHKVSSIYPPTKLFFRCLAVTDLCVGLVVQPLSTIDYMSRIKKMNSTVILHVQNYRRACGWMLCTVSVSTSVAISVDRLLALLLGLRYRHGVTLRRVCVVIICLWIIGALMDWSRFGEQTSAWLKSLFPLYSTWQPRFSVTRRSTSNYDIIKPKYKTTSPKDKRRDEGFHWTYQDTESQFLTYYGCSWH